MVNAYPEYFKEFLDDPSACSLVEFYETAKAWGAYLMEHPELNYLTDDSWKEIRERLIDEFDKREDIRWDILDEWEELTDIANDANMTSEERVAISRKRLDFMKLHQEFLSVSDEKIQEGEEILRTMEESYEKKKILEKELRRIRFDVENSIAELDDELVKASKQYGKPVHIPSLPSVKKHNGN